MSIYIRIISDAYYVYNYVHTVATVHYILIDWSLLEKHLKSFCPVLPHNYQSAIDKLKTIPQLSRDGGVQLSKLISSSTANRKITEKIITYLIVKLCYNDSNTSLVRLCDVMDESIDSTDTSTCLQEIRYGTYVHCTCVRKYVGIRTYVRIYSRIYASYVNTVCYT